MFSTKASSQQHYLAGLSPTSSGQSVEIGTPSQVSVLPLCSVALWTTFVRFWRGLGSRCRCDASFTPTGGQQLRPGEMRWPRLRLRPYTSMRWSLRSLLPTVLLMVPLRNSLISRLWNALTIMYWVGMSSQRAG